MTSLPQPKPRPLPRWVILGGSALVLFHFLALGAVVLAAPSGPWPVPGGFSPAVGPFFASKINQFTGQHYLRPLHMTHDYHFVSNVVALPTVVFEVRLKDDSGKVLKTLKYPDEKANFWVRHRQRLLAQGLGNDLPVQRPQGQQLLPPGQTHPKIRLWKPTEGDPVLRLEEVSTLELPDMPLARPSDWAVVLAQSYARFLCRQHGAAKAEVVRKSRNALVPDLMFVVGPNQPLPPDTFAELSCNFGEYRP